MTGISENYGQVLFDLGVSEEVVHNSSQLMEENPEVLLALSNPAVSRTEKNRVIEALFEAPIQNFLKVMCSNGHGELFPAIVTAYEDQVICSSNRIRATFRYVMKPEEDQFLRVKKMVCEKYKKSDVVLALKEEPGLIGGFILNVLDDEYDNSISGRLLSLKQHLVWR